MAASGTKGRKSKAVWDDNKDKTLLDELLKQCNMGRRAGNSFKPKAWNEVTTMFNKVYSPEINVEQVKTRVRQVSIRLILIVGIKKANPVYTA